MRLRNRMSYRQHGIFKILGGSLTDTGYINDLVYYHNYLQSLYQLLKRKLTWSHL